MLLVSRLEPGQALLWVKLTQGQILNRRAAGKTIGKRMGRVGRDQQEGASRVLPGQSQGGGRGAGRLAHPAFPTEEQQAEPFLPQRIPVLPLFLLSFGSLQNGQRSGLIACGVLAVIRIVLAFIGFIVGFVIGLFVATLIAPLDVIQPVEKLLLLGGKFFFRDRPGLEFHIELAERPGHGFSLPGLFLLHRFVNFPEDPQQGREQQIIHEEHRDPQISKATWTK